jgi:hypothetical protein
MMTAVDKRQPRRTRGDDGGGRELATNLVADKKRWQTREMAMAGKRGG